MAEMSNIDHAKLENRQIFSHGDIDDYASVAFILSSSLYPEFHVAMRQASIKIKAQQP